jgi:adenosylhomocysteine nucleosidase
MTHPNSQACDLAITFALAEEAGGLVDRLANASSVKASGFVVRSGTLAEVEVAVVETGVGGAAAARAVTAVLRTHRPRYVISAGFAGALNDGIKRGELLLPTSVLASEQPEILLEAQALIAELPSDVKMHRGRLVSADAIVRLPDEKRELGRRFAAQAVDMETYAVARACQERSTPLFSVRIISDDTGDEIPADIAEIGAQATKLGRVGAALDSLWRRPGSVKDMLRLRERALIASDALADFLVPAIQHVHALNNPATGEEPRIDTDETRRT